jgi:penicillin-binding protein 2
MLPSENPKIAVVVVVENVGFGGTHAAPIAKKMMDAYLLKDKLKNQKTNTVQPVIAGAQVED